MKTLSTILRFSLLILVPLTHQSFAGSGAIDPAFAPTVSGPVYALAVQANGQLLIGGSFGNVNGIYCYNIARLYADGSLDTTFQNNLRNGVSGQVNALAVQSDGQIVIGGNFSMVNGSYRYGVARLNDDGAVDGSFVPTNNNYYVNAIAVQSDNKVIVGSSPGGNSGTLYRLNADGTMDGSFFNMISQPNIYAIAIQPDGKILVGGSFSTYVGTTRYNLARLNTDGSLDGSFLNGLSGASSPVRCIVVQPDGKILIGGDFTMVNNISRFHVARLTSTGAVDTSFSGTAVTSGSSVYALSLQDDGSVIIGGNFMAQYYNGGSGALSYSVARLFDDGTMDTTFICPNGLFTTTYATAVQNDGGIVVGGNFSYSQTNRYLARVYGDLYPPQFIHQPTNRLVGVGSNVTFTADVSNPTPVNFQWLKNGSDIPGATDQTYTLHNVQLADAGTYAVFATDGLGGVTSSNAILTVGIPPAIISQQPSSPADSVPTLVVTQGQAATFSVVASGTPLNYFWKTQNGGFIRGATNASLTITNTSLANQGYYFCQVSNFLGNVTSEPVLLTVLAPPGILAQPAGQSVCLNSNFTVSVVANGTGPLAYEWFKDTNALTSFQGNQVTVTNAQLSDAGSYFVIITNSFGSITSSVAWVSLGYAPVITQQPLSITNAVGDTNGFSVAVFGSTPILCQWYKDGTQIPHATNSSLLLPNLQPPQIGYYSVSVTNAFGGVVSSNASLNLTGCPFALWQGLLAWYPFANNANDAGANGLNGTVNGGTTFAADRFGNPNSCVSFDGSTGFVSVSDPAGLLNFDARINDYTVTVWVDLADTNNDYCLVIDRGTGQAVPTSYTLRFIAAYDRFQFDLWDGTTGVSVTNFTAPTPGQWCQLALVMQNQQMHLFFNGGEETGPNNNGGVLPGGFGSTINADGSRDFGRFAGGGFSDYFNGSMDEVRLYNRALSASDVATVYAFESGLPFITSQPQSQTNWFGGSASFTVVAASQSPLLYQWQFNGANLSAATNAILVLTNLQYANAGNYCVAVSNALAGLVSSNAALAVSQPASQIGAGGLSQANGFSLSLTGLTGHGPVIILASTNLLDWNPILTNPPQIGAWQFNLAATNWPQCFYRAVEQ